jgi:hypothetical protein
VEQLAMDTAEVVEVVLLEQDSAQELLEMEVS